MKKLTNIYEKIILYTNKLFPLQLKLETKDKWAILFYPLLVMVFLIITDIINIDSTKIKDKATMLMDKTHISDFIYLEKTNKVEHIVESKNPISNINTLISNFKSKNEITNLKHINFKDSTLVSEVKILNDKISQIYIEEILYKIDKVPNNVINFLVMEKINTALMEQLLYNIPVSITLAQAASESSWGSSNLTLTHNNYFGIKCKGDDVECTMMETEEHLNKKQYESLKKKKKVKLIKTKIVVGEKIYICKINDGFKKYPNFWYSFRDHSEFLSNNDRYAKLFQKSSTYLDWCEKFKPARDGGVPYATSIHKSKTLKSIIERYKLYTLDF